MHSTPQPTTTRTLTPREMWAVAGSAAIAASLAIAVGAASPEAHDVAGYMGGVHILARMAGPMMGGV